MAEGDVTLSRFDIELPSGQKMTNELYANGRHQCQVNLIVEKKKENAEGIWVPSPLTSGEIESATIIGYGFPDQGLPQHWTCEKSKGPYDLGVWRQGVEMAPNDGPERHDSSANMIRRFLSCNAGRGTAVLRFIGRIIVGGETYTTISRNGTTPFNSFVDVQAIAPYLLTTSQLTVFEDHGAYWVSPTDIDVYYYTPPPGLRFVEDLGLADPAYVNGEGSYFQTSFVLHTGNNGIRRKGGVVPGVPGILTLGMIQQGLGNRSVEFNKRSTIMRAIRFVGWIDTPDSKKQSAWRLLDNFGCQHVFYIHYEDNGNLLKVIS